VVAESYDKYEQSILRDVDRVGWSLMSVSKESPMFMYSVGIEHTLAHPEIIVFGLQVGLMAKLINGMGQAIREGRRFDRAGLYDDLLEDVHCKIINVLPVHHRRYCGYAMWHRRFLGRAGTLRVIQCMWPDKKSGIFPDQPDCPPSVVRLQPMLDRL
jgi:Domain of unknown function (DUF4262)